MAGSSAGPLSPRFDPESSSQRDDLYLDPPDNDSDDPVALHSKDAQLLGDDPLDGVITESTSFRKNYKQSSKSGFTGLLAPLTSTREAASNASCSPVSASPRRRTQRGEGSQTSIGLETNLNHGKDGVALDWYSEGPGRRVGYEDLTAIDWIFEYTKERQRLRALYTSASGLVGYFSRMVDSSQVWIVLILSGMATGIVAASIDVASDWLGDLKGGYCAAGVDGGKFYLNKYFCCFGYDDFSKCGDWTPWSSALHVYSAGGKWFIEYFFFLFSSVGKSSTCCDFTC